MWSNMKNVLRLGVVALGGSVAGEYYRSFNEKMNYWSNKANEAKDFFGSLRSSVLKSTPLTSVSLSEPSDPILSINDVGPSFVVHAKDPGEFDSLKNLHQEMDSLNEEQLRERLEQVLLEFIETQRKHKTELRRLEIEIECLKKENSVLHQQTPTKKARHKSLVEMYGEVLDILSDFDKCHATRDSLPRVVVVGDQSSGKTSVLEFIAKARIFPRGSGEMMTRTPVMVTMSEGVDHVASFRNETREYNLKNPSEVAELRNEIRERMQGLVKSGKTISSEAISLKMSGPGIPRMVLVDLPGIINTVTSDMSPDTKDSIISLAKSYMSNPNAIILCVQDGSTDAERSLVTDLVGSIDPEGTRSVCVLTKLDLAEQLNVRPERIQKLLSGKLFPMKALNYFAVISGTGDPDCTIEEVSQYEEEFFRKSLLFKNGAIKSSQATTHNLIYAVTQCFWDMVRSSVDREADNIRSRLIALEAEWRNNFPNMRELDRDELFERARGDILDDAIEFTNTSPNYWDNLISKSLWENLMPYAFRIIYLSNALTSSKIGFQTQVEIMLERWIDTDVSSQSIQTGMNVMLDVLAKSLDRPHPQYKDNTYKDLFKPVREKIYDYCKNYFKWSDHNAKNLRIIQQAALRDGTISNKADWDNACSFMESVIIEEETRLQRDLESMVGLSKLQQWTHWTSRTPEQITNHRAHDELSKFIKHREANHPKLTQNEMSLVMQNLHNDGVMVKPDALHKIWECVYLLNFCKTTIDGIHECRSCHRTQDFSRHKFACNDVVLFYKLHKLLVQTVNTLRQQIYTQEARRMESLLKEELDGISSSDAKKLELLQGRQVELAAEIKRVVTVRDRLDRFTEALHREKDL